MSRRTINITRFIAIRGYEVANCFLVPGKLNHSSTIVDVTSRCNNFSSCVHLDVWRVILKISFVCRDWNIGIATDTSDVEPKCIKSPKFFPEDADILKLKSQYSFSSLIDLVYQHDS